MPGPPLAGWPFGPGGRPPGCDGAILIGALGGVGVGIGLDRALDLDLAGSADRQQGDRG